MRNAAIDFTCGAGLCALVFIWHAPLEAALVFVVWFVSVVRK